MGDSARYILKTAKGSVGLKPQVTMARKRDQRGEDGYEGPSDLLASLYCVQAKEKQ